MLRITDRYILREVLAPFLLALLVLTFLLMIPTIMGVAEMLIARGVDSLTILRLMGTLIPSALGITIPMALLLGVLMGLGRLSSDREAVALQACGVSLYRMLYPLALLSVAAGLSTLYILAVALPDANQAFREIVFRTVASRAEGDVKPRVFDDEYFPNVVLYVREVSSTGGGWSDVFLADTRESSQPVVFVAQEGRVVLDSEERRVEVVLRNGTRHQVNPAEPDTYQIQTFDESLLRLDPESVFPTGGPARGYREMTIPELQEQTTQLEAMGLPAHSPIVELHRKFSIPVACLVFALIGLGLGVTSRKDGKLASFVLGIGVIFTYYVLMYGAEATTKASVISPHLAMWVPNIVLGLFGLALVVWRSMSVERRVRIPFLSRREPPPPPSEGDIDEDKANVWITRLMVPQLGLLRTLDWYVTRVYLGTIVMSFVGLLGIFYISTFVDLSDKLFKGQTTGLVLLRYFWYATPQFTYYVLPIAALVASLVTVGVLTKSSELTVMKACGISLYRAALPIFLLSLAWGGALFGMSETILGNANRQADRLNFEIRSGVVQEVDVLDRQWIVAENGAIYHYLSFEPDRDEFGSLSVYDLRGRPWELERRTFVAYAKFEEETGWVGRNVWVRDLASDIPEDRALLATDVQPLAFLEPPDYFETDPPDAERMNVRELEGYIERMGASGFPVVKLVVDLHRKISFPFVTLILTLIAVPFAVTMGPRGALYGIGVGLALACTYWITMSVFGAIGSAGMLAPMLAAWAPNLLFGGLASYLLLSVRT